MDPLNPSIYWHDPFNRYPTEVYHYRHPDPALDVRVTPWDYIDYDWEDEDNPWKDDPSWMDEEPDGWPDPSDW